ncbi:MAG TPA: SDR family oxidoreductase [Verrucomicrobiae bacterium]|nr:SDR family oxidoreductase [Verrucomicrobiae bacterium]
MKRLMEDKVALVTGGTSGIGRAAALALSRAGAKVVVAGRREAEGYETVALIEKAGGQGKFIKADVSNEGEVEKLVADTVSKYGRLDAAFNNAGIEGEVGKQTHEQSAANYRAVMDINVLGVLLAMKHEIGAMLKNGGGSIVNNASVGALVGFPGVSVYVASKHAVLGLTKTAALEYAKQGIRVNAVSPGGIETPMLNRFTGGPGSDFFNQLAGMHPVGRLGRPEEIAEAVLWLSSDKASFVTGLSLTADGGWTAQ